MAVVTLTERASDKSTYVVTAAFTDENGDAVAPDTMTWTLTDAGGTVVNDREDEAVASPTASEDIVLSGDDLKASDGLERVLTVEATYTSDLGSGLPLRESCRFYISDLVAVA